MILLETFSTTQKKTISDLISFSEVLARVGIQNVPACPTPGRVVAQGVYPGIEMGRYGNQREDQVLAHSIHPLSFLTSAGQP